MPYYVLVNNASYIIECQEADRPADPWIKVNCALDWQKLPIIYTSHNYCHVLHSKLISLCKVKLGSLEIKIHELEVLRF